MQETNKKNFKKFPEVPRSRPAPLPEIKPLENYVIPPEEKEKILKIINERRRVL